MEKIKEETVFIELGKIGNTARTLNFYRLHDELTKAGVVFKSMRIFNDTELKLEVEKTYYEEEGKEVINAVVAQHVPDPVIMPKPKENVFEEQLEAAFLAVAELTEKWYGGTK